MGFPQNQAVKKCTPYAYLQKPINYFYEDRKTKIKERAQYLQTFS